MKVIFTLLLSCLCLGQYLSAVPVDPGQEYLMAWQQFYPSQAVDQGIHAAIFQYEDRSPEAVRTWITFNKQMLLRLQDPKDAYRTEQAIDARLLRNQVRAELERWEREAPHQHSLTHYATLIADAIPRVLDADFLTLDEKNQLTCRRLTAAQALCKAARQGLMSISKAEADRGNQMLITALTFYGTILPQQLQQRSLPANCIDVLAACQATAAQVQDLIQYVETRLPITPAVTSILGREEYARQLTLYTDSPLTPETLAAMALDDIEQAKKQMATIAREYLIAQYPREKLPEDEAAMVKRALADMEKDAPLDAADYLNFWQELAAAAVAFLEEKQIAKLPAVPTLRILTAPESAGPAARIGWVDSAPAFAPNPVTTLYLPSIPDTLSAQEQIDFWASFNKPFNRMIVIHELFPGHYMQFKVSRETPHPVRLLFPYEPYFEGWATFVERVCLDAGWEAGNHLTYLAHLRKRVENANRAYTSVQVHCNGWSQEQVMQFSTETSLLAPQFAKSLWGRIIRSPLQLTSYFWGGRQFTELMAAEQRRRGEKFNLKEFMDTIMRTGPVPIDEFPNIFSNSTRE
ncbi:MAG: DUF885 family protein [Lewinellaceae bacterium]|nr:DUF885 family protein [Lewinellaceae bacterium]